MRESERTGYLVLARRLNEGITLTLADGQRIHIVKVSERAGSTRIGIKAPANVRILRDEIQEQVDYADWGSA